MIIRFVSACAVLVSSQLAFALDHPLDLVPEKALGAIVFPKLSNFKTKGDAFVAAVEGGGFNVSNLMQMAGAEFKVSGAANDDEPMGVFLFDSGLIKKEKRTSMEAVAAAFAISDIKRLAKNLGTDVETLEAGKIIETKGRFVYQQRFCRFVDNRLWVVSHKVLFEHVTKKDLGQFTKKIPPTRAKFLKGREAIAVFAAQAADNQIKRFDTRAQKWLKENADADEEEKQVVRELFELLTNVTHLSISMGVDEGLELDTELYFSSDDTKAAKKLMKRLNPTGKAATLAGLPTGNVLLSHASATNGQGSLPSLTILARELFRHWGPSLRRLDDDGFLSHSQKLEFVGIFGEVWQQLDGYRFAVYRNKDTNQHGLVNIVGILDTDDPQGFIRDMQQLAGFVDGTGLDPKQDDRSKATAEAIIKQLVEDLGDRNFRKRHSATIRLILIGEPVLLIIGKAKESMTPEVARRAQMIEAKINAALKSKRSESVRASLITQAQPEFIFFPDRETRKGQAVHWVEIKTRPTAQIRPKLRVMLGPQWQHIRLVPLKNQVVFMMGSDVDFLDQTLTNLAKQLPGLAADKANAVCKRPLHKKHGIEFNLSPSRFLDMRAGKWKELGEKPGPRYEHVSMATTLTPRYLNVEWRIPQGEVKALSKAFR